MTDNYPIIRQGLQPTFEALRRACIDQLTRHAVRVQSRLEENDMDMEKAYPRRDSYGIAVAVSARQFVTTNWPGCTKRFTDPDTVKMRDDLRQFIEAEAKSYAEQFIDSFARKMAGRVDFEVTAVDYQGSMDPFQNSQLKLEGMDGAVAVFRTKCIVNRSKYDRLFNQWPTRRVS